VHQNSNKHMDLYCDKQGPALVRFHVVGLPFTQTTGDFPACAFTMKVRKFCQMMLAAGHTVYLYSGEQNETLCTEHVACISEVERQVLLGDRHYTSGPFDAQLPEWQAFNLRVAAEISKRAEQRDFICVIGGTSHKPIADLLPHMMTVEFGIGYPGTFAKFRVFESYAWMHAVYGSTTTNPATLDGRWYDAVIPGYVDAAEFPMGSGDGGYLFFIGRLVERKGYQIAAEVAEHLGKRLIVAGVGTPPTYGEYVGVLGLERARYFAEAEAVFVPTQYVEPFGTVNVEAQMTGTPVITTDWGAFVETVEDGVTGYRCRTFGEFVQATKDAPQLDRQAIRDRAVATYSLEATAPKYERYFHRLSQLWDRGWYTI
jgi:glycosyltransferase involved in cell wall biosynthesis